MTDKAARISERYRMWCRSEWARWEREVSARAYNVITALSDAEWAVYQANNIKNEGRFFYWRSTLSLNQWDYNLDPRTNRYLLRSNHNDLLESRPKCGKGQ